MKLHMDKDLLALLRRLGLNQYESSLYLALLSSGPATASELSDTASIPRPRAYDVLEKLEEKGFVEIQPGRPTKFRAVSVAEAFASLKRRRQEEVKREIDDIEKIRKELENKIGTLAPPEKQESSDFVWVLRDRANISSRLTALFENATKEITIATTDDGLKRELAAYENTLKKAKERGVTIRILVPRETEHSKRAAKFAKVLHRNHSHRFAVVDDHAIVFLTPESEDKKEVSAWIRSPFFADNLKKLVAE